MTVKFNTILHEHSYKGNMITKMLPKDLDNTLFSLIHMVGGFDSGDIIAFARNANNREINLLTKMVNDLDLYCDVRVKKFNKNDLRCSSRYKAMTIFIKVIAEEGGMDTLTEDVSPTDEIYKRLVPDNIKKGIFKSWDRIGHADWRILKAFGVEINFDDAWTNSGDILYPMLEIEWLGGIENTRVGKSSDKLREISSDLHGGTSIKYKAIPLDFDYLWDQSGDFGERGYSCWDIRFEISKDSVFHGEPITDIFDDYHRLETNYGYNETQFEVIEWMWEDVPSFKDQFNQFCAVEVSLV